MKLIKKLENPCTEEYKKLKEFVLSEDIEWYYNTTTVSTIINPDKKEISFHSHVIMQRPNPFTGIPYSLIKSDNFVRVYEVLEQVFNHNNIGVYVIYRINFNSTFFNGSIKKTPWHTDLNIPHKNLIIYMNKFKHGQTYVKNGDVLEQFSPKEDEIIVFDGDLDHCHAVPREHDRRIVLVANYLEE